MKLLRDPLGRLDLHRETIMTALKLDGRSKQTRYTRAVQGLNLNYVI